MLNRRHECPIHCVPLRQSKSSDEDGLHPINICFDCMKLHFSTSDIYAGFTFFNFNTSINPYGGAKLLAREGVSRLPKFTVGINYFNTDVHVQIFDIVKHADYSPNSLVDEFYLNYPSGSPELMNLSRLYTTLGFLAFSDNSFKKEFEINGW